MTVVECFERAPLENMAACLWLRPDRLILVGQAADIRPQIDRYRRLLRAKGAAFCCYMPCSVSFFGITACGVGDAANAL